MIDRKHIERYLRLNGLDNECTDDEIKSLLLRAKWHEDDVDTAIVVLREDPETKEQAVNTYHQSFSANERLSPETLSSLLGMDIEVDSITQSSRQVADNRHYHLQIISIAVLAVAIGLAFLCFVMWQLEIAIFT